MLDSPDNRAEFTPDVARPEQAGFDRVAFLYGALRGAVEVLRSPVRRVSDAISDLSVGVGIEQPARSDHPEPPKNPLQTPA